MATTPSPLALTSPSNQSYLIISPNMMRLQSSGMESTPQAGNTDTDSKKVRIEFEEYIDDRPQNELVIGVEDSFDCKFVDLPGIRNFNHQSLDNKNQGYAFENKRFNQILKKVKELELTIEALQRENGKLNDVIQTLREQKEDYILKHQHLKQIIRKKDQTISNQKQIIQSLGSKAEELEKNNFNETYYKQKIKSKDIKIRQILKKTQKLLQMNRQFEIDLKESNDKVLTLERQIQMHAYNQMLQNRVKFKQSVSIMNKENYSDENYRKSFQNPQRKGRLSNILAYQKKTKSNSNTGRLKH